LGQIQLFLDAVTHKLRRFTMSSFRIRHISLLLLLSCSTALTAFAGKPTSYPTVSLTVTANANQTFDPLTGTPTNIVSDGALGVPAPYIDGQKGVCASFNATGDLTVDFDCNSVSPPRELGLYLTLPLAPPSDGSWGCTPVPSSISPNNPAGYTNHLATSQLTSGPNSAPFQAMKQYSSGDASTIYYVQIYIATKLSSTTAYRLNYHLPTFPDATYASLAQVRRTSSTQWIIESAPSSTLTGNPPNAAMLVEDITARNKSTTTECGFYSVPFSFTLDQK
jgi:hypothetical protein